MAGRSSRTAIACSWCIPWIFCVLASAAPPTDIDPNLIYYNTQNTTAGSQFQKNLESVLGYLAQKTPLTNSTAYWYGNGDDIVYGFCECYNMTQSGCGQCINITIDALQSAAPLSVGARSYMNRSSYSCYLRYELYGYTANDSTSSFRTPTTPPSGINFSGSPPPTPTTPPGLPPPTPRTPPSKSSSKTKSVIVGTVVGAVALLSALLIGAFIFCRRKLLKANGESSGGLRDDLEGDELMDMLTSAAGNLEGTRLYRYEDLLSATENFSERNKLGQGGFGTVYKGVLPDGEELAVKKLLLESFEGKKEFVNEVVIISTIQHRNLLRLEGFCVEGRQRLLVLEYLANGSLDRALFGGSLELDWPTRYNIVIGIASGLAYLHEESHRQIIHRDIKASNVLLDDRLNAKIADFGISKLFGQDKDFTSSTRVAGTFGYLAPEYALRGKLTPKADIFSFGVLVLEIVSGRKCSDSSLPADEELLLEWAWKLYANGELQGLIDKRLDSIVQKDIMKTLHIALLCTQEDPDERPVMSKVVAMLMGYLALPPLPTQAPAYFNKIMKANGSSSATNTTQSGSGTSSRSITISRMEPR